jgi:ABC-type glycerol-3-phosphate transport system substrate-binding protein
MKTMKRAVLLIPFLVSVSMLWAGGNNQKGVSPGQSGPKTEIRLQVNEGSEQTYADSIAKFESENNAAVVLDIVQWDQCALKYALSYAAGRAPDVVELGDWSIRGDILNDRLYPLNEFVSDAQIKEMNQGFVKRFSNNGKLYSLISTTDCRIIFYNKAIFRQAGLDPGKFPETWAELMSIFPKLNHVRRENQYAYGFTGSATSIHAPIMWETLVRSLGSYAIDPDTGKILLGNPQTVRAAELYREILNKGYAPRSVLGYDETELVNEFTEGNFAVMLCGSWIYPRLQEFGFNMEDLGWAKIPKVDNGIFATIGGVWAMCISAQTKNPPLAWKLVQSIYNEDFLVNKLSREGQVPVYDKYFPFVENDPFLLWIANYFRDNGQAELHSAYFLEDIAGIGAALNTTVSTNGDIKTIFDKAANELNTKHNLK